MGRELLIVSADILCYTVTKSMRQSPSGHASMSAWLVVRGNNYAGTL